MKCAMSDINGKQYRKKATKTKDVLLDNELYSGTQFVKVNICKRCFDLLTNFQTLFER